MRKWKWMKGNEWCVFLVLVVRSKKSKSDILQREHLQHFQQERKHNVPVVISPPSKSEAQLNVNNQSELPKIHPNPRLVTMATAVPPSAPAAAPALLPQIPESYRRRFQSYQHQQHHKQQQPIVRFVERFVKDHRRALVCVSAAEYDQYDMCDGPHFTGSKLLGIF